MARNEEKQQGRLNRLWLQREREEGRLKDALERRPKLSTLNSASSVKKWIPSIQKEIEYCLQSQLTHYPERKIAEFQLQIESLEKEYKRFVAKLRVLDPTCKQRPWTPRSYSKRRADTLLEPTSAVKNPRPCEPSDVGPQQSGGKSAFSSGLSRSHNTELLCLPYTTSQPPLSTGHTSAPLSLVDQDQDQPLCFDKTRLAVATAAFRGPLAKGSSSEVQNLAMVLQSKLPNLTNSSSERTLPDRTKGKNPEDCKSDCEVQKSPREPSAVAPTDIAAHVLGLDYNSSSDDE